jgi:hypothetical protein
MTRIRFTTNDAEYTVTESKRNHRIIRLEDGKGDPLVLDRRIYQRMREAGVVVEADAKEKRERWEL